MKVRKAVIPAAGLGTRLLPATKAQPKEMLPIFDTPLIQFVVEEAVNSGITDILIITGKGKRAIEDHFDLVGNGVEKLKSLNKVLSKANIYFKRQPTPKGLGDAILHAESFIGDEPFAVLLGDDFYINCETPATKQLMDGHEKLNSKSSLVAVETLPKEKVTSKGMVCYEGSVEGNIKATDFIEKPKLEQVTSNLALTGRYIFHPEIFKHLKALKPAANGEVQLTDAIKTLLDSGNPVFAKEVYGTRIDIGTPVTYLKANLQYVLSQPDLAPEFRRFIREQFNQEE